MGPTQDCILGVLSGTGYALSYPGVEAYVDSIQKSGFRGRKVMLYWDIHPAAKTLLEQGGFEMVEITGHIDAPSFFHKRLQVASEYMKGHWQEFRYVFWLDIKDLVVQSDPSKWMENNLGDNKLVAACECVTIGQEETNRLWAIDVLGEDNYQKIKDCEVINGGTWAGRSEAVKDVLVASHVITSRYIGPHPPCQPAMNFVMHVQFKESLYIPRWEEGFAACLHPFWSPSARSHCNPYVRDLAPVLDGGTRLLHPGQVGNPKNEMFAFDKPALTRIPAVWGPTAGVEVVRRPKYSPFAIVHGYDRDWHIRCYMEEIYSTDSVVEQWAKKNGLALVELNPSGISKSGYRSAWFGPDLWLADNSVGVVRAIDTLPALRDTKRAMEEIHRVLAPDGWLIAQAPSTEGRGAFENPTHKSRWNIEAFRYFTTGENKFFHEARIYDTRRNDQQVVWTHAHLINLP